MQRMLMLDTMPALVCDALPCLARNGFFRFAAVMRFHLRYRSRGRRDMTVCAHRRMPDRLVCRAERPADVQPQQADYGDITKPDSEMKMWKWR